LAAKQLAVALICRLGVVPKTTKNPLQNVSKIYGGGGGGGATTVFKVAFDALLIFI